MLDSVVIVGASLAGLRTAELLRRKGYAGKLTLIGDEPHLPYDRPPLSKQLLTGAFNEGQIALRRKPYEDLDLDLRLGERATALDVERRVVTLASGAELPYDAAVLAILGVDAVLVLAQVRWHPRGRLQPIEVGSHPVEARREVLGHGSAEAR